MPPLKETSQGAYLYAVRELGKRAGVDCQTIARWRVQFRANAMDVYIDPVSGARVTFPYEPAKALDFRALWERRPSRFTWMNSSRAKPVADFVVPFERGAGGEPLFRANNAAHVVCCADLLTAAIWTLSRAEELELDVRDHHDRVPAAASIAYRAGYLERPIIDEYGLAFAEAISALLPGWKPVMPAVRVKLSHDMDLLGLPSSVRSTAGHLYPRCSPGAFATDVLARFGVGVPAYLRAVSEIARISHERGLDSAFYWTGSSETTRWDAGYDLDWAPIRRTIESLVAGGFEIGLHPAYGSYGQQNRLEREAERLRQYAGDRAIGGRQHYLRWTPPTWKAWESAGLAYDSTVGFADAMGFRAGTSVPYHPWLLDEDRESKLLEIPLVVMDCTPVSYMGLDPEQTLARIEALFQRCRATGGVFTLLWHNTSLVERHYRRLYPRILDLFLDSGHYEWERDLPIAPLPQVEDSLQAVPTYDLPRE